MQPDASILTINCGSSSIKLALYRGDQLTVTGQLSGIGQGQGRFKLASPTATVLDRTLDLPDHPRAFAALFDWLKGEQSDGVQAVGHRVVHGGSRFQAPQHVTTELLAEVRRLVPFDPLHLPSEIEGIEAIARLYPHLPQVACFDTAFHVTIPEVARLYALPRRLAEQGIRRYGFHGLSYEYIVQELGRLAGADVAAGRLVIAHLGSGASMAAVKGGRCVDTTMGFTPTGGLVMATRCGDIDPGVLLYLLQSQKLSAEALNDLVNHESGLLGLGGTADMRELLERSGKDVSAEQAVAVFCHQARKFVAALSASLGGLDSLIFTAGIGERSAPVRNRICADLGFLGIEVDASRNAANEPVISTKGSRVTVRVIPTNEELMIARHTRRVLQT